MRLSPVQSNPSTSHVARSESCSPLGGPQKASLGTGLVGDKGSAGSRGLQALQQDTFEMGSGRSAQLQKLLLGTEALMQTVQALGQLVQLVKGGGMPPAGSVGATGGAALTPYDMGSVSPESPAKAPGEPTPSAGGTQSPVNPSGEAKVGAGMPPPLAQYKGAIESAAAKAGVPAGMLVGQIWQESRGNLQATSTNGGNGLTDTGLMQVNPNTFKELQAKYPELQGKNLADPETNILAGAFYMKDMKEQFGSWDLALRGYNSGPNGVDRSNPDAIPAGTGDATYVQKVKQFWNTVDTGQGALPA